MRSTAVPRISPTADARPAELPRYPSLIEMNTRVWLHRRSRELGKPITLVEIDDATLDDFACRGFDWIWLLSVWQTGAASDPARLRRDWTTHRLSTVSIFCPYAIVYRGLASTGLAETRN